MTRLVKVILGVALGLGLAWMVQPWILGAKQTHQVTAPTVVGGF